MRLNINVRFEPIPFDTPPNIIIVFYVYEFDKVKCDRFAGRVEARREEREASGIHWHVWITNPMKIQNIVTCDCIYFIIS